MISVYLLLDFRPAVCLRFLEDNTDNGDNNLLAVFGRQQRQQNCCCQLVFPASARKLLVNYPQLVNMKTIFQHIKYCYMKEILYLCGRKYLLSFRP